MPKRASKWIIHDNGKTWDLSKGGRYLYEGLGSKTEAIARLRNHHRPGEPVFLEEKDGFRTNITEQLKRSGIL